MKVFDFNKVSGFNVVVSKRAVSVLAAFLMALPAFPQNERSRCLLVLSETMMRSGLSVDTVNVSVSGPFEERKAKVFSMEYDDGSLAFASSATFRGKSNAMKVACSKNGESFDVECGFDASDRITILSDSRKPYSETWKYGDGNFPTEGGMVFDSRYDLTEYFPVMAEIFSIDSLFVEAGDGVLLTYDTENERLFSAELTGKSRRNCLMRYGFCKVLFDLGRFSADRMPFKSDPFEGDMDKGFDFLPGISPEINSMQFMDAKNNSVESPSGAAAVMFEYESSADSVINKAAFFDSSFNPADVKFRGGVFSSLFESYWLDGGHENHVVQLSGAGDDTASNAFGIYGYKFLSSPEMDFAAAYGKDTKYVPVEDFLSMGRFGMYMAVMEERNGNMVYQASYRGYDDDDRAACDMGYSDIVIRYIGHSGVVEDVYYRGVDGGPAMHEKYGCARISTRFTASGKPQSLEFFDANDRKIRVIKYKEYSSEDYQFCNPELEP